MAGASGVAVVPDSARTLASFSSYIGVNRATLSAVS
jgi:hypothetical protein